MDNYSIFQKKRDFPPKHIQTIRISYFSGTGGTRLVAEEFARVLKNKGFSVDLHNIRDKREFKDARIDLLILIYAVHACNAPKQVYRYIDSLPSSEGTPAAVISVSGGGEMFPNTACRKLCQKKLAKKNFWTFYEDMMMMPSNCILETPAALTHALLDMYPIRVVHIVGDILQKQSRSMVPNFLDRIVSFAGKIELIVSRFYGRILEVTGECSGCCVCEECCEAENIIMTDGRPVFRDRCDLCLNCVYSCPSKALQPKYLKFLVLKKGFSLNRPKDDDPEQASLDNILKRRVWTGARRYLDSNGNNPNNGRKSFRNLLRFVSLAVIILILLGTILSLEHINGQTVSNKGVTIANGIAVIDSKKAAEETLFSLEGDWSFYPGVFCDSGKKVEELDSYSDMLVKLPIPKYSESGRPGTYRLNIETSEIMQDCSILLPYVTGDFLLYLNGVRVADYFASRLERNPNSSLFFYQDNVYPLPFDPDAPHQEIIISINSQENISFFYKQAPLFGKSNLINAYAINQFGNSLFNIGVIILILLNGLIFMTIRPFSIFHTLLCLFDTLIGFRILFGINAVKTFLGQTFLHSAVIMPTVGWLQVVLMLSGCLFGMMFIVENSNRKMFSPAFIKGIIIATATLFLSLALFPWIMETQWYYLVMAGFLIANLLLLSRSFQYVFKRKKLTNFIIGLHNLYAVTIVGVDLWQLGPHILRFNLIIYAYFTLFAVHLFWRLFNFNLGYEELEKLNTNLESVVAERTTMLRQANDKLTSLSERDALTGIYNRLYMDQRIEQLLEEYSLKPAPLYLCLFDLDYFKRINDTYGHDEGDEALKDATNVVQRHINNNVTFGRIGGEEFLLLIQGMQKTEVFSMVESIRQAMEENARDNTKRATASFGLVEYNENVTYKEIFKAADQHLYRAKSEGRNRISTNWLS